MRSSGFRGDPSSKVDPHVVPGTSETLVVCEHVLSDRRAHDSVVAEPIAAEESNALRLQCFS